MASAAPLPPLNLPSGPTAGKQQDFMAALASGLGPIKSAIDQITAGAQAIVQAQPGMAQAMSQVIALAQSALSQSAMQMVGSQGAGAPGAGQGMQMPQPPGPPPPMGPGAGMQQGA